MRNLIFPKNVPIDEKRIAFIEKVVARLTRRSNKVAKAIITPCPISNCITGEDIKGDVLKYMFTSPGVIKKGGIFIHPKPKSGSAIVVTIENDLGGESRAYNVSRRNLLVEPNLKISAWDRLTISFHTVVPEEKVKEVWISLLWVPDVKDADVKNYLLEELDK